MATKLLADSNRASLREIIESNDDWGVTPVEGISRARRFTSSSIVVTKETVSSEEIRDDRMVSSIVETSASSGGEINWEFAAGSQDNDFQRVLMGNWSRPMTFDVFRGKTVAITTPNTVTISDDTDISAYFRVGRRLKLSGFVAAANNDYVQVLTATYAAGVLTIVTTTATLVAEPGSAFTTVADANDVVILKNDTIRFGQTARTIDSGGANAFEAAIAAKQLATGQRIFVEGVGYETGSITLGTPVDGETITIGDGENEFSFEAQTDADVADADALLFAVGADDTATAANLAAKINALRLTGDLNLSAKAAAGVVTLINLNKVDGTIVSTDDAFTIAGFAGGSNAGGFYTLVTVSNDALIVDRDVPVLPAGKAITIKASMLRNPSRSADIQPQSFSLETGFQDVGQFFTADGLRAGNIAMEVSAGALITGSTTTMGRETKRKNVAKLTGQGYIPLDAAATENVSATANVGALAVNGVEASTAIQSISLSLEGNLRAQQAVGSKFPIGIAAGKLNITGTITVYFADGAMYDRFLNHETVSLSFPIIDPDKNTYFFTVPAFKLSSNPIAPGGTDQDVMETLEIMAFRDAATKCMMQIDRFSSTSPITAL
jgi:hypothetical protein